MVLFLPLFLFYFVVLFSRKLSEKILLALGPCFPENLRERTLGIWHLCSFDVFWCCFCPCFLSYYVVLFSRKLSEKILLALGPHFAENFRERTLGTWHLCSFDVFWCCFCLCFCFIMWWYSPESCLKNSPSPRSALRRKFFGANFGFGVLC